MTDEGMRDAQQLTRRHRAEIAQIEQKRTAVMQKIDIDAGIAERVVDQFRVHERGHQCPPRTLSILAFSVLR